MRVTRPFCCKEGRGVFHVQIRDIHEWIAIGLFDWPPVTMELMLKG